MKPKSGNSPAASRRLHRRTYNSYHEYVLHQSQKLDEIRNTWLDEYERQYPAILEARLRADRVVERGQNVLCLGARLGAEVRAFIGLGCFAVGIDLNPGPNNPLVLHGDFHRLQYADTSIDIVFSNALDHAFELAPVVAEIARVLKPNGYLILEIVNGTKEGVKKLDEYGCLHWDRIDDVLRFFTAEGFAVLRRAGFNWVWPGEHICLQRKAVRRRPLR